MTHAVTSYAQHLKNCYQKPLPDEEKLLGIIDDNFIELAVINSKNIPLKEADNLMTMNIHGQTDKILLNKPSIPLGDILKPGEDGKPIQRVLVEGAPGIGKSRLAWELCYKWAREELDSVKHYKLVVLVQLRGKRAQEAKVLHDVLFESTDNKEQAIDIIGNGDGVLIVLEGFNELPDKQRKNDSVYIKLIKRKLLPEATVIITSRPSVYLSPFHMKFSIDRHLEILGFTEARIEDYARSVNFRDPKTRDDFLDFINGTPFIKGMMYLPLNAVFVASIFEAHRTDLSYLNTMTQLYDAVIRSLIRRNLIDKKLVTPDDTMPFRSLQSMEDIKKLPDPVPNQLLELARIAYEGLLNDKYVFTDPGFGSRSFDHLGIMKKTVSLVNPATGPIIYFYFPPCHSARVPVGSTHVIGTILNAV